MRDRLLIDMLNQRIPDEWRRNYKQRGIEKLPGDVVIVFDRRMTVEGGQHRTASHNIRRVHSDGRLLSGRTLLGKIAYVSDFLDPASRTAKVRCVVSNADARLKLEMFADVLISTVAGKTTPVIPTSALQEVNGAAVVFVQRDVKQRLS